MSYVALVKLVQNVPFRDRIQYALWSVAVDVLNDAGSTPEAKQYARKQLRGAADTDVLTRLAIRCVSNPTIAAAGENAADSDIRFVVAGVFSELVS